MLQDKYKALPLKTSYKIIITQENLFQEPLSKVCTDTVSVMKKYDSFPSPNEPFSSFSIVSLLKI